jgi:hypothetical protein
MDKQHDKEAASVEASSPANSIDTSEKATPPDADRTLPGTLPSSIEEATKPLEESTFTSEHDISRNHAEPTAVTGTTNDNAIEGEYIDVGGGD